MTAHFKPSMQNYIFGTSKAPSMKPIRTEYTTPCSSSRKESPAVLFFLWGRQIASIFLSISSSILDRGNNVENIGGCSASFDRRADVRKTAPQQRADDATCEAESLIVVIINYFNQYPKMKSVVLACLIASTSAFFTKKPAAKVVKVWSPEEELGAQAPLGFYDPLGLVADGDQAKFDRLRYVEIKHGRISMLAVAGYLVQEAGVRLPGNIDFAGTSFASIPNGFGALEVIPGAGLAQLFAFVGFLELAVMKDITGGEFVGDFRNDFIDFGWDTFDEETKLSKRAIELNQGRAAQMGILALMVHEKLGVSLIPSL